MSSEEPEGRRKRDGDQVSLGVVDQETKAGQAEHVFAVSDGIGMAGLNR